MFRFTASLCRGIAISLLALAGTWAGSAHAANYTTYADQATWTAEDHSSYIRATIAESSGYSGYGPPAVYMGNGFVPSLPNSSSAPLSMAFGGIFDLTPGGNGGGLAFLVNFADSTTALIWSAVPYPGGFWGIVSDTTITSVMYVSNDLTGNGESFNYNLLTMQFPVIHICTTCIRR